MKKLVTLTALTLITLSTPSHARQPMLKCTGMPADNFESIEVYDVLDGLEVVTKMPGQSEQTHLVSDVDWTVEAILPLPPTGTQERSLQWRHTGYYLTTYSDGVADRVQIDCL